MAAKVFFFQSSLLTIFLCNLFLFCTFSPAQLYKPELNEYTGPVTRIHCDKAGRLILTCSLDKTARLCTADGSVIKVLRVPSQGGPDGLLYACALSPDGLIAVLGGWTVDSTQDKKFCVYVISTLSGLCKGIIRGLPGAVSELEFTPDGKMVVAGFFEGQGIALLDIYDISLQKVISESYHGNVYSCSFDNSGRLVTSCSDGVVRLYDKDFRFENSVAFDNNPYRAAFSGNGEKIAIGFEENSSIIIIDGFTLKKVAEYKTGPDLRIIIPAWDGNGNLFAASTECKKNRGILLSFNDFTCEINPLQFGPVLDFCISGTDQFLYSGLMQEYGFSNDEGRMAFRRDGQMLDFSELESISCDYSGMRVCLHMKNMPPVVFSVPDEVLRVFPYSGKKDGFLSGSDENQIRCLKKDSCSHKFTICNRDQKITVDEWRLYCQGANGDMIWSNPLSSKPLNISPAFGPEMLVVAFYDGVVRWFDLGNGDERLSLFIHKNLIDWALWTPDGFWDASAGGTKFLYSAASQTHGKELLINSLQKVSIYKSGEQYRPQLKILYPSEQDTVNDTALIVTVKAHSFDEPFTSIQAEVNGVIQTTVFRGIQVESGKEKVYKTPVLLNRGENRISVIIASGKLNSEPAMVNVYCKPHIGIEEKLFKPQLNIFAAGISHYCDKKLNLRLASKDAGDFAGVIEEQKGGLYGNVRMELLTDSSANRNEILDALDRLRRRNSSNDVAVIYLAGHGVIGTDGRTYFLPWDAKLDKMARSCIPFSELRWNIDRIKGKVLLFLDACYSGSIELSRAAVVDEHSAIKDLLSSENGAILFCASARDQLSQEDLRWNNSAFTKAFLEAVGGKADYGGNGVITVSMIELYISQRVKELTKGDQTPVIIKPESVRDFPFVIVRHFGES